MAHPQDIVGTQLLQRRTARFCAPPAPAALRTRLGKDLIAEVADFAVLGEAVIADWITAMDARGLDGAGLVAAVRAAVAAGTGSAPGPCSEWAAQVARNSVMTVPP